MRMGRRHLHRFAGSEPAIESVARWARSVVAFALLLVALLLGADDADARLADGSSLDRGNFRIFAPASVAAPAASPAVLRRPRVLAQVGSSSYPGGSLGGLFNRPGLIGGFAAGFLGSGLLGLMFGQGVAGGLTGAASFLGLAFQLALLAMLGRLIWMRWNERDESTAGALSPRQLADPYLRSREDVHAGLDVAKDTIKDTARETAKDIVRDTAEDFAREGEEAAPPGANSHARVSDVAATRGKPE